MRTIDRLPPALRDLVEERGGVVARRELLDAGLTRARVRTVVAGSTTLVPGVYDVTGASTRWAERSLRQRAWAAVLHVGPSGAVDGAAALRLHGLTCEDDGAVAVSVPDVTRVRSRGGIVVTRRRVMPATRTRAGLPVVDVPDAVLGLATTERAALSWVTAACQQRLTTSDRLRDRLQAQARHPQRRLLDALLADIADGSTSVLEVAFRRNVLRAHRMPLGTGQLLVPGTARRADIGFEDARLLCELDSSAFHAGAVRSADLARDVEHLAGGWATARFGWVDATAGACIAARRLHRVLRARGGHSTFRSCHRCRT